MVALQCNIYFALFDFSKTHFYNISANLLGLASCTWSILQRSAEYGTISILVIERYHNVGSIFVNAYNIRCCPSRLAWIEDRYAVYDGNILIKSIETLKEV